MWVKGVINEIWVMYWKSDWAVGMGQRRDKSVGLLRCIWENIFMKKNVSACENLFS